MKFIKKYCNHPENEDRTDIILRILTAVLTFAFLAAVIYIPLRDQLGRITQSAVIKTYEDTGSGKNKDSEEELRRAERYNQKITELQSKGTFFYRGTSAETDIYRSMLDGPNGIMCVLEIPAIDLSLPVGHGTSDEVLETMAGHVCGTSLPVGGTSSNTVIAAHSGLTSSRLFSDLDRIEPGDEVYLHTLSRVLTYKVLSDDDISVVLPYDGVPSHAKSRSYDVPYFQVRPDEDILTLYTCTPIGINSHRLIVQACRVETDRVKAEDTCLHPAIRKIKAAAFSVVLALIPIFCSYAVWRHGSSHDSVL